MGWDEWREAGASWMRESWSLPIWEDIEEAVSLDGGSLCLFRAGLRGWRALSCSCAWQAGLQSVSVEGA